MGIRGEALVKKWLDRTSSSAARDAYRQGIDSVTESPMAKAAEADDRYLARVEESVRSGRRRQSLLAVPLTTWKERAKSKGAERLASGASAAVDRYRSQINKWGPVYDEAHAAVQNMPKGTIDDALARVRASVEIMMRHAGRM